MSGSEGGASSHFRSDRIIRAVAGPCHWSSAGPRRLAGASARERNLSGPGPSSEPSARRRANQGIHRIEKFSR